MKKALLFTIIAVFLLTLSVVAVSAQTANLTVDALALGGEKQSRSNPKADKVEDRVINVTGTLTFKNNDAANTLSNIQVSTTAASKFNVVFSTVPQTLAANTQGQITVTAKVPEDLSSFKPNDVNGNTNRAVDIGDITITGTLNGQTVTATGDFTMEAENQLTIDNVKIEVNGKSQNVDNNDDVEVRPGDKLILRVKAKNLFSTSDNEDLDIEEIELEINIDNDGDFDIEDDTIDFGDIGAKENSEESIAIDVEDDAEKENHNVILILKGEDENRAVHGERFKFTIEVKREAHDLKIQSITISPDPLTCSSKHANIDVRVINIGRDDEEEGSIKLEVPSISFRDRLYDIEIDEDDEISRSFRVELPEDLDGSELPITVETYYDRTKLSDSEAALLSLPTCKKEPTPIPVPTPEPVPAPTPQPVTPPTTVEPEGNGFGTSDNYLWALGIIIVVLIVAVIILAAKFVFAKDN